MKVKLSLAENLGRRVARRDCRYHTPLARRRRSLSGRGYVAADRVSLGGRLSTLSRMSLIIEVDSLLHWV